MSWFVSNGGLYWYCIWWFLWIKYLREEKERKTIVEIVTNCVESVRISKGIQSTTVELTVLLKWNNGPILLRNWHWALTLSLKYHSGVPTVLGFLQKPDRIYSKREDFHEIPLNYEQNSHKCLDSENHFSIFQDQSVPILWRWNSSNSQLSCKFWYRSGNFIPSQRNRLPVQRFNASRVFFVFFES
jgi:hypothetical protein